VVDTNTGCVFVVRVYASGCVAAATAPAPTGWIWRFRGRRGFTAAFAVSYCRAQTGIGLQIAVMVFKPLPSGLIINHKAAHGIALKFLKVIEVIADALAKRY